MNAKFSLTRKSVNVAAEFRVSLGFTRYFYIHFRALSDWLHINQSDIWKENSSVYQQRRLVEKSDWGGKIDGHFGTLLTIYASTTTADKKSKW